MQHLLLFAKDIGYMGHLYNIDIYNENSIDPPHPIGSNSNDFRQ